MATLSQTIKITLAATLLLLLGALSGAAVLATTHAGSGSTATPAHVETASDTPKVSDLVSGTVGGLNQGAVAAPSVQEVGTIDARTAVRTVGPAVVTVINQLDTGWGSGQGTGPTASGSGVIISKDGYIVTNNHVVENQQSLQVIFSDGRKVPAKLVGTDPISDLAVIKVETSVPAVAQFGDSDKLEPGQPVVAIGSALGDFRNTVTAGVVSALHRDFEDPNSPALRDLIQTDAAINHGNSGGPLIDLAGKVVGINTAVVRTSSSTGDVAEGLGFAIPSNTVRSVTSQLIANGAVPHPFLGLAYQVITPQIAAYYGLPRDHGIYVTDVASGSPADKAGIQVNSIVTRFDGANLDQDHSLLELLMKHKVGDKVTLSVLRPNTTSEIEVTVTLESRPKGQ